MQHSQHLHFWWAGTGLSGESHHHQRQHYGENTNYINVGKGVERKDLQLKEEKVTRYLREHMKKLRIGAWITQLIQVST